MKQTDNQFGAYLRWAREEQRRRQAARRLWERACALIDTIRRFHFGASVVVLSILGTLTACFVILALLEVFG